MSDERIVDVSTILSKWHDLLKDRWPNFPCQTFQMFMHNNSQELVRCKDCECSTCIGSLWNVHCVQYDIDVPNNGFCYKAERK